jgi:hypothetical protein
MKGPQNDDCRPAQLSVPGENKTWNLTIARGRFGLNGWADEFVSREFYATRIHLLQHPVTKQQVSAAKRELSLLRSAGLFNESLAGLFIHSAVSNPHRAPMVGSKGADGADMFEFYATRANPEEFWFRTSTLPLTVLPLSQVPSTIRTATLFMMALFAVLALHTIIGEIEEIQTTMQQGSSRLNAMSRFLRHYKSIVNWVDLLQILVMIMLCGGGLVLLTHPWQRTYAAQTPDIDDFLAVEAWFDAARNYGAWYGWGMACFTLLIVLQCFSFLKVIRFHPGLWVYVRLFTQAWDQLKDFFVFYFVILVFIAVSVYGYYTVTGGNESFDNPYSSLENVARNADNHCV